LPHGSPAARTTFRDEALSASTVASDLRKQTVIHTEDLRGSFVFGPAKRLLCDTNLEAEKIAPETIGDQRRRYVFTVDHEPCAICSYEGIEASVPGVRC
jgi:hypothetical protein